MAFGVLLLITGFFSYEVFINEDKIQEKMIDMMVQLGTTVIGISAAIAFYLGQIKRDR